MPVFLDPQLAAAQTEVKELKTCKEWAASTGTPSTPWAVPGCMQCSKVAVLCFGTAFALNIGLNNFSLSLVAISPVAQSMPLQQRS